MEKRIFTKSAKYYEEALNSKNDPGTLSTLALIYHLIRSDSNFNRIISELEKINPNKAEITNIRFGKSIKHPDTYYDSLLKGEMEDEEIILSLIHFYSENNEFEKAFKIGDKLIQLFNKIEYKEFTSGFGVSALQFKGIHVGLNYLKTEDREIFNQGLKYIQECSDFYKGKEIEKYKAEIFANRAIYETWNENYMVAIEFIEYAISLDNSNFSYLKILAAIYSKRRVFNKALETFYKIPTDIKSFEDLALLKSVCHFALEENDKAVAVLEEEIDKIEDFEIKQRTLAQLLNYYFLFGEIDKAQTVYKENIRFLDNDHRRIIKAKLLHYEGESDQAQIELNELKNKFIETKEFSPLVLDLGNEFSKNGEFDSAIQLYEAYANYSEDTFFVKSLYDLYVNSGKLNKVLEICIAQRKESSHKFYTRNEIAIYYGLIDHDNVIKLGVQYLKEFPDDVEIRLNLIHSLIKIDRKQDAQYYLNYPFVIKDFNERNAGNLLDNYLKLNLHDEAFEKVYALLAYNDNAYFNDLYMKVNIFNDKYLSALKMDRVSQNASVKIIENGQFLDLTFVNTSSDENIRNYYNEVKIDDPKYYRLFGSKIGTKEFFNYDNTEFEIEIVEIKHKYDFAYHKAIKKCGTTYKSESIFKMVDTSSLRSGQLPDFIKNSLQESEKTNLAFEDFLKLYESGKIPLMSIALFTKRQFIDVWNFCKYSTNHFIRSCSGNLEELEHLNSVLETAKEKKLLFDISSILLFYKIGIIDCIKKYFSIYVLQDAIDYLEDYIAINAIGAENESSTIGRIKGENYLIKKTAEQKEEELNEIRVLINWIKVNFKIHSPELLLQTPMQDLNKYTEVLGSISAKGFIISSNSNITFLCEDLALRNISISEFKKPAVWTQAIIHFLKKQELITANDYNFYSRKIVEQNVLYTHTNSEILFDAFSNSDFKFNSTTNIFLNILRGNQSDNSAFVVGFGFLKRIWEEDKIDTEIKRKITFELLLSLYIYRCSREVTIQIKALMNALFNNNIVSREIENQLIELNKYIRIVL